MIRSKGEILVQVMPFGTRRVLAEAAAGRNDSAETNAAVCVRSAESGAARNQQSPSEERCDVITADAPDRCTLGRRGALSPARAKAAPLCG